MAFLRTSTPRPLFWCSDCNSKRGPRMLQDNDALGDPREMVKAHQRSTGHRTVLLIGGHGLVQLVDPSAVKCIRCMDSSYLADSHGVVICPCVEEKLIVAARR